MLLCELLNKIIGIFRWVIYYPYVYSIKQIGIPENTKNPIFFVFSLDLEFNL